MALIKVDRLKAALLTSNLSQTNPALYQVINQLIDALRQLGGELTEATSGGGTAGITGLTGDVVAGPGSGVLPSTIQPLVVTTGKIADSAVTTLKVANDTITTPKILDAAVSYEKIQDTAGLNVLIGRGNSGPGTVEEITLGTGLAIDGNILEIQQPSGTIGLEHRVLSELHLDSIPAVPVFNDIIYAGPGIATPGTYVNAIMSSLITEERQGIFGSLVAGFNGNETSPSGISGWGAPPVTNFITPPLVESWLTWNLIDAFMSSLVYDDIQGSFGSMILANDGFAGNIGSYSAYPFAILPVPGLDDIVDIPTWQRLPIGNEGEVLGVLDGNLQYLDNLDIPGTIDAVGKIESQGIVRGLDGIFLASITAPVANVTEVIEQIRASALGEWVDVAFNAGDFTASGGSTPSWTITAPQLLCFRYRLIGTGMTVQFFAGPTTVAGTAPTELRIKIPAGYEAIGTPAHLIGGQEAGAAVFDVYVTTDPPIDDTLIFIRTFPVGSGRAFNTTPAATWMGFTLDIRIQ